MALSSNKLTACDVHEVTNVKQAVLGTIAHTADGRKYRYAKNGGAQLAAGATVEAATQTAYASTASKKLAIGDALVPTAGTVTAANAPKYEDGTLTINNAKYLASGVTQNGVISLQDAIDVPAASGATTSLAINPYCGVVAGSTKVIGTAEVVVPANAYFWAFVSA